MVNQNIHTMKQPELGKRISELRKQKGLTQEELVEQCNINVRTIQRIEAGEVNPRSYTIKTILNVLGVNYEAEEEKVKEQLIFSATQKKAFNIAWIFGVVYFIIGFIETAADIYQFTGDDSFLNITMYALVKLISAFSFAMFFYGFYTLATAFENQRIKIISALLIIAFVLSNLTDIFSRTMLDETIAIKIVIECILFGGLQLIFGITLIQLKDKLGQLALATGILEVIVGASLATVIFASVGIFFLLPAVVLEIILLYRLTKK